MHIIRPDNPFSELRTPLDWILFLIFRLIVGSLIGAFLVLLIFMDLMLAEITAKQLLLIFCFTTVLGALIPELIFGAFGLILNGFKKKH